MVAIFTGAGTGMERSSVSALGARGLLGGGSLGASGDGVSLNAANGNLMISRLDEFLVGLGPDASIARTYNSQAVSANDDNGDQWRQSTDRRIFKLTGTQDGDGSTITRLSEDGSETLYTWSGTRRCYVTTDGEGAYDTLTFATNANVWTWQDGRTGMKETYEALSAGDTSYSLKSQSDPDGNTLTFSYDANKHLDKVTTKNLEYLRYTWDGDHITEVTTGLGATTFKRTTYGYDARNRLSTVTVDLTPENATDSLTYQITYSYAGTSKRVTGIKQSDGSELQIAYQLKAGTTDVYQVKTLTEVVERDANGTVTKSRVTSVAYTTDSDTGVTTTTITDPIGTNVVVTSDAAGNLTQVAMPATANAPATSISITYTADGKNNVLSITDENKAHTDFDYTAQGLVRTETDRLQNVTRSAYNTANQLTAQARSSATDGTNTLNATRYVYDTNNPWRVAYTIDAAGGVAAYTYDASGELTQITRFVGEGDRYDLSQLSGWSDVPTSSQMNDWATHRPDTTQRDVTQFAYDARGGLVSTTSANGTDDGSLSGGVDLASEGRIIWAYDQSGRLTSRKPDGTAATTTSYDGLGRVTATTDANGGTTTFTYAAGGATVTVQLASGLIQTSVHDATGTLISYSESGADTVTGTSSYAYDRRGLLRREIDATGRKTWHLYDQYGRKIADVVSLDGSLAATQMTEYKYDKIGRPIAVVQYNGPLVSTAALDDLTSNPDLASLSPLKSAPDRWNWTVYDAEGRVLQQIDGDGSTVVYGYDRSGQLISTRRYANTLTATQVAGFKDAPPLAVVTPTPNASGDTSERIFYDAAGRVTGRLDPLGYLVESRYDAGGRKIAEISYADPTTATLRATGTLTQLVASVSAGAARTSHYVYDGRGDLRFAVDPAGAVVEYDYHSPLTNINANPLTLADQGQVQRTIAYDGTIAALGSYTVASVTTALADAKLAGKATNRTAVTIYDGAGRVGYTIGTGGAVTRYGYDSTGNVIATTAYAALRTGGTSFTFGQMNTWATNNADSANDRTIRTWYDARGQARFVADAENFVTETIYDAEGRVTASRRYVQPLASSPATVGAVVTALGGSAVTTSSTSYDGRGLVRETVDAGDVHTTFDYSVDGKLVRQVQGVGTTAETVTTWDLDAAGQVLAMHEAVGKPEQRNTTYTYDSFGNLASRTIAGNTTWFYYDAADQLTNTRDALGGVTTNRYNAFGEVTQTRRYWTPLAATVSTATAATPAPDDARDVLTYRTYDQAGRLAAAQDAEGYITEYGYDAFGEQVAVTRHAIAVQLGASVAQLLADSRYRAADDVVSFTYYDKAGRVSMVSDAEGYVTEYGYTAFGDARVINQRVSRGTGATASAKPTVVAASGDRVILTYFNRRGQVIASRDAEGYVTDYTYDAAGNRTVTSRRAQPSGADVNGLPPAQTQADIANNVVTRTYYDALGRVTATRDALNFVVEYGYDALGNVTRVTRHAAASPGDDATGKPIIFTNAATDAVTGTDHDALGRVKRTTDAEGFMVDTTYDAAGNVWTVTRYGAANTAITTFSYDVLGRVKTVTDAEQQTESYGYDALGNRITVTNKLSGVTSNEYDRRGLLTKETVTIVARVAGVPDKTTVVVNTFAYDAGGNLVTKVEAANDAAIARTTTYVYDRLDRQVQTVGAKVAFTGRDGAAVSGMRPTTAVVYDAFGNRVAEQDATGATTFSYFNRRGDKTSQVAPDGTITTWTYNADGTVRSQRTYDTRLTGAATGTGATDLPSDPNSLTSVVYRLYDIILGRAPTATELRDWIGKLTPGLSGTQFGNATTTRAYPDTYGVNMGPLEAAFTALLVNNVPGDTVMAGRIGGTGETFVRNVYRTAFGREADAGEVSFWAGELAANRWTQGAMLALFCEYPDHRAISAPVIAQRAAGGAAPVPVNSGSYRETIFTYDANGRLTGTKIAGVRTGAWTGSALTSDVQDVTTATAYDAFGNVVLQTDERGAQTFFYYNRVGGQIGKIDQENYLTVWDRDADGNVTSETRYSSRVTDTATATTDISAFRLPWFSSADDRVTVFTYDRLGRRLTETRLAVANYGVDDGGRLRGIDGNGQLIDGPYGYGGPADNPDLRSARALIYRMYDIGLGRAPNAGEITFWLGQFNGNLNQPSPGAEKWSDQGQYSGIDMAALSRTCATMLGDLNVKNRLGAQNDADFIVEVYRTAFRRDPSVFEINTWVDNIQKLGWSRGAVFAFFSEHADHRALTDSAVTQGIVSDNQRSATISYQYNGLGEVTSKQEANGDTTSYQYDTAGRQTRLSGAGFYDKNATLVQTIIDYSYDRLDQLTSVVQNAVRTTSYTYDGGGRLLSATDAAGNRHDYGYDAAGHQVLDSYQRQVASGGTITTVAEQQLTRYDAAGRVIARQTLTGGAAGVFEQIDYTAHGEVAQRSLNGVIQDRFFYDKAGNLWASRSGDGAWRYFVCDAAGNQTLAIESDGATNFANLPTLTDALNLVATADGTKYVIGQTDPGAEVVTITTYDLRGQATQTIRPTREVSTGGPQSLLVEKQSYNAFGEVASTTDATFGVTDYSYTTTGKLSAVRQATVKVMFADGSSVSTRPTTVDYYDISGRRVGTRDAEGNLTTYKLVAGTGHDGSEALSYSEFHADGGVINRGFNVFGDLEQWGDTNGTMTYQTFDALSNQLTKTRNGVTDTYAYDLLGQRIRHTSSVMSGVEETDYDSMGRVSRVQDLGGDTVTHGYVWDGTIAAANLGTKGGWTETTAYWNGGSAVMAGSVQAKQIETSDAFGHVLSRTDIGGHKTDYTYDSAGRLLTATTTGETITNSWLNTGMLGSVTRAVTSGSDSESVVAAFTYDGAGRQRTETQLRTVVKAGVTTKTTLANASATWDALGRMQSWAETGVALAGSTSTAPAARVDYAYDANGNVRWLKSTYRELNADGSAKSTDSVKDEYFLYDSMNRLTRQGYLVGNSIVRDKDGDKFGIDISYKTDGNRAYTERTEQLGAWFPSTGQTQQTQYITTKGNVRETYVYYDATSTNAGRLKNIMRAEATVNSNGTAGPMKAAWRESEYTYNARGLLATQKDFGSSGAELFSRGGDSAHNGEIEYDAAGRVTREFSVTTVNGNRNYQTTLNGYGSGASYALGALKGVTTESWADGTAHVMTSTANTLAWYGGAVIASSAYKPDTAQATTFTTTYGYDADGMMRSAVIDDGRPRRVDWTVNASGQAVRRDEANTNGSAHSGGDPHQIWYRHGGAEIGTVGNDGDRAFDYEDSIGSRLSSPGQGAFRGGATTGVAFARFGQSWEMVSSFGQGADGGRYTVEGGDTLSGIALRLWGDSSLWYKLAQANGLAADSVLVEGQVLTIPAGVVRSANNAGSLRPYDPSEIQGNTSPTTPKPQPAQSTAAAKKKKGCGVFGAILIAVIAIAVTVVLKVPAANLLHSLGVSGGVVGGAAGGTAIAAGSTIAVGSAAAIGGGVVAGIAGSVVSQAFGLATGIQDQFDWKGVALAGLSAGIGGGLGKVSAFGTGSGLAQFGSDAVRGALGSALTQGVAVATGLQSKFDFVGVAAAGIGAGVGGRIQNATGSRVAAIAASGLSNAATRSVISGTDFGDNVLAALPDMIAQTVGGFVEDRVREATQRLIAAQGTQAAIIEDAADQLGYPRGSAERAAFIADKQRELASLKVPQRIRDARINDDTAEAAQIGVDLAQRVYGYTEEQTNAAGGLLIGDGDINVNLREPVLGSKLLDRVDIQAGHVSAAIDQAIADRPILGAAVTLVGVGLAVADPLGAGLGVTLDALLRTGEGPLAEKFRQNGYGDADSKAGGTGLPFLASLAGGKAISKVSSWLTGKLTGLFDRTLGRLFARAPNVKAPDLLDPTAETIAPKVGIQANKAAGDAIRDVIAAREAPSMIEQSFTTVGGVRRVDVVKLGDETLAIESKVGRTSLGSRERQELARDWWLQRQGQVGSVRWEFSPSGVNGGVGPSPALQRMLDKLGFQTRINP